MINFFGFYMSEINITSSLHVWRMMSGSSAGLRASHQDTDAPSVSPCSLHPGEICCHPSLCSSVHNVPFSSGPYSTLSRLVLTNLLTVCIDLSLHFLSLLQWASGICRWSFSPKLENWGPLFLKMAFMFPPLPSFSWLPITRADTWFFFPHGYGCPGFPLYPVHFVPERFCWHAVEFSAAFFCDAWSPPVVRPV